MKYIADTTEFHIDVPTVVTLGKFDGRHRGHQKLMRKMMEIKAGFGYETAVFTFSVTPAIMVTGQRQPVLTTNLERRNNLKKTGIDWLVEYPFTEETKHMQPEEFVREVLVNRMNARAIVVGTDCGFGYRRSGNAQVLTELSGKYGYQLYVIEKERDDRRDISSTYIREELEKGNVEKANALLGEPLRHPRDRGSRPPHGRQRSGISHRQPDTAGDQAAAAVRGLRVPGAGGP